MNFSSTGTGPDEPAGAEHRADDESIPGLDEAEAFIEAQLSDADRPVVMFTIGTCSWCWATRRFFREAGIAVADHDLLTDEFTAGNRAARIRTALRERTGSRTLPQVFVGGTNVGGAEDLFAAFDSGRLTTLLEAAGIVLDEDAALLRARDFLPNRPIAP